MALSGSEYGVKAPAISDALKVWVMSEDGTLVCAVLGPGTSQELQANWTSPFEGEALGSKFEKLGGVAQAATGMTMTTTFNSRQVWQGNRPMQFNLEMIFFALSDPQNEVTYAIRELQRMESPEVNALIPMTLSDGTPTFGNAPKPVTINMGKKIIYKDCVIENVSRPFDGQFTSDGHQVRATVNVQISSIDMLNRSKIV